MIENNETISNQMEFYLLNCFNIIKEICRKPPDSILCHDNNSPPAKNEIKKEILYIILDYFIILNEKRIFEKNFEKILKYSEGSTISYKFYIILKKFCLKYFSSLHLMKNISGLKRSSIETTDQNLIKEIIDQDDEFSMIPGVYNKPASKYEAFKRFIDISVNALKTNLKEEYQTKGGTSIFSIFFTKKKNLISKELDGSNIIDFFTILNTSEEFACSQMNNVAVFSVAYELVKFIHSTQINNFNDGEGNNYEEIMLWSFGELRGILHSYCIRIFDQSENYLESNKNKLEVDKNTEYNLNLIEAAVWQSVKIINLVCKIKPSLVSNINMRMKQVFERIALKQSGLVFLEILQFFIDNCNLINVDLDYYVSEFFKLKLKYNYKYEILSFTTLEFLYKNKEILNEKTSVFSSFFPLIIKIFATFPKYLVTKFFMLVEYMTKPSTITELFNYILDLPAIIIIIENFEVFKPTNNNCDSPYNSIKTKMNYEEIFQNDYIKLAQFLLRDIAFEQEYQFSNIYSNQFNKQVKFIFETLVFTSRVHSTTKMVSKLIKKFFDVIIKRDECESASETIILIFERFSYFHENENYIQEIRNLLIRKLEEIFKKWPQIVTLLREKILLQIKNNYSDSTKRELICLLCWSLGEFLDKRESSFFEDEGIVETFDCLEKLLRDKIKFFSQVSKSDANSNNYKESVEDVLICNHFFII
jgi:hypothetical protein